MEFKLIVAGGRDFNDYLLLFEKVIEIAYGVLDDKKVSIVSGMAQGADAFAYHFAKQHNIVCYEFPADWDQYGKHAGYLRNKQMGDYADGLLAFWDGKSKGTANMIAYMLSLGKFVSTVRY